MRQIGGFLRLQRHPLKNKAISRARRPGLPEQILHSSIAPATPQPWLHCRCKEKEGGFATPPPLCDRQLAIAGAGGCCMPLLRKRPMFLTLFDAMPASLLLSTHPLLQLRGWQPNPAGHSRRLHPLHPVSNPAKCREGQQWPGQHIFLGVASLCLALNGRAPRKPQSHQGGGLVQCLPSSVIFRSA